MGFILGALRDLIISEKWRVAINGFSKFLTFPGFMSVADFVTDQSKYT
jgi:hypothetical protein